MFCSKCGKPVKGKTTLCRKCAKDIKAAAQVQGRKSKKRENANLWAGIAACAGMVVGFLTVFLICRFAGLGNVSADGKEVRNTWQQEGTDSSSPEAVASAEGTAAEIGSEEHTEEGNAAEAENQNIREELLGEREARIMALYEQKWLLQEAARGLVADRLETTPYVTVAPREQFSIADVVLDEMTGNLIVSESAKEMYRSFSEGKSLSDICLSTAQTAWEQVPEYLSNEAESLLQDMVIGLIGMDVFSAWDFVSKWQNADDMPHVLVQKMANAQQNDIYKLTLFLDQENLSAVEFYQIAQLMYAIQMRKQEMDTIENGFAEGGRADYRDMRTLALQYAANEAELLFLTQTEFPEETAVLDEAGAEAFESRREQVWETLEYYSALRELELGNVSVNYDVEGFREAQRTASQSGVFGEMIMGEAIGGVFDESIQTVEDWVQEERAGLCDRMTDSMEESYWEVALAEEAFNRQYGILENMASASGNDRYFADLYFEQTSWKEDMEAAAEEYLDALAKYLFDIESAYLLYDCILTGAQADFLFELMLERDQVWNVLQSFGGTENRGYSNEEAVDRWNALLLYYTQSVDQLNEWGAGLGQTPGVHANGSLTVYGDASYSAYSKEFAADSRPLVIYGRFYTAGEYTSKYYYDMNGQLLCVVSGNVRITYRSVFVYSYTNGENMQYQWELDAESMGQRQVTDCTDKAYDIYNRFVN